MAGSTFGFLIGPTLGGWLPSGQVRACMPGGRGFSIVAAAGSRPSACRAHRRSRSDSARTILRVRAVAVCAARDRGGGTIAMMEPVLSLFLSSAVGLGPARSAWSGGGAIVATVLHPVFGRVADRVGGRRLTLGGLAAIGVVMPLCSRISSFESGVGIYVVAAVAIATFVTPSLTYMAEATSEAASQSFGVAYGSTFAWSIGLLIGPASADFFTSGSDSRRCASLVWRGDLPP